MRLGLPGVGSAAALTAMPNGSNGQVRRPECEDHSPGVRSEIACQPARGQAVGYNLPGCIMPWPAAESAMHFRRTISRLDIYIFRQVLFALIVATGGLTALIWLTQSLRFVDLVVNRGL